MAALSALAAAALLAGCVTGPEQAVPSGKALYLANCAACHGAGGRGDGPAAAGLPRPPADLTTLSATWQGFPRAHVMGYAHGYHRKGAAGEVMPAFDAALEEPMVLYDIGDGIPTPTPLPLLRIADYLETLQDPEACAAPGC